MLQFVGRIKHRVVQSFNVYAGNFSLKHLQAFLTTWNLVPQLLYTILLCDKLFP
jgi:hypothetical protein